MSQLSTCMKPGSDPGYPGFRRNRGLTPVLFLLLLFSVLVSPLRAEDEFLDPEDAFRFSAAMAAPATLDLHYIVAPEYYMYRERFELEAPQGVLVEALYPPGLVKYDPTFEKDMEVYYGQVTVRLHLGDADSTALPPVGQRVPLAITSQGCADAGLCYPPETRELQLAVAADGSWSVSGQGVVAGPVPPPLAMVLGADGKPLDGGSSPGQKQSSASLNPLISATPA